MIVACDDGDDSASRTPDDATAPVQETTHTTVPTQAPSPTPAPDPTVAARLAYEGEYEAAIEAYDSLDDDAAGAQRDAVRLAQARLLLRTERYDEARALMEAHLAEVGPAADATPARFMHAAALEELEEPESALASYDRYVFAGGALTPYAHARRAVILGGLGRPAEAQAAAAAIPPGGLRDGYRADMALDLGRALQQADEYAPAAEWYTQALTYGDTAAALTGRADARRLLGDPGWTVDAIAAVEHYPSSRHAATALRMLDEAGAPISDYLRGVFLYRTHRNQESRDALERAITADDRAAEATYYIAALDERAGETDDAIDGYERSYDMDPATEKSDDALWWRGRLLQATGRNDEATDVFAELADRFPFSEWARDARFQRGMTLYRDGDYDDAASAWADAAASTDDEERAQGRFWLGRAQREAGDDAWRATLSSLVDDMTGNFYALRAEVVLGENAAGDNEYVDPASSAPDWGAIAAYVAPPPGQAPFVPAAAPTADPRWATAHELEAAGLPDEAEAVFRAMVVDNGGRDLPALLDLARRFHESGRHSLAARAAATIVGALGERAADAPADLYRVAYPLAYGDLVQDASRGEDVSPLLLLALVRQESFYDPFAGSSAGALGLTQVIEPTGRAIAADLGVSGFTVEDLYRPRLSLRFGASYIADQLDAFDGNAYHALAAYNGGPGTASNAIDLAGDDIDLFVEDLEFDETRLYVKLVMENYARYRQLYGGLDRPSLPH